MIFLASGMEIASKEAAGGDYVCREFEIEQRCSDLGITAIINPNTGRVQNDLRPREINSVLEHAVHEKAKKIHLPFLKPNKKDVKDAIDFLELLGVFLCPQEENAMFLPGPEARSRMKRAGKMLEQLEGLRKNMTVSKSALKSDAKTTIVAIDKLFSMLTLTEKLALKDSIINAEKIIKMYFQ